MFLVPYSALVCSDVVKMYDRVDCRGEAAVNNRKFENNGLLHACLIEPCPQKGLYVYVCMAKPGALLAMPSASCSHDMALASAPHIPCVSCDTPYGSCRDLDAADTVTQRAGSRHLAAT